MLTVWMKLMDRLIGAEADAVLEQGRKRLAEYEEAEAAAQTVFNVKMREYAAAEHAIGAEACSLVNEFRRSLTK